MEHQDSDESLSDASEDDLVEQVVEENKQLKAGNSQLRLKVDELQSTVMWRTFVLVAVVVGLMALFPFLGREHEKHSAQQLADLEYDIEQMDYGISLSTNRKYTRAFFLKDVQCRRAQKPIWGIAVLPHQLFVLHEKSDVVDVYLTENDNHTYEMPLKVTGLVKPMDMVASTPLMNVFIADWAKSSIFRIDKDGDVTFWSVGERPHGLAMNFDNNILVTCPVKGVIKVFTPTGKLVDEIKLAPDMNNPWHAIQVSYRLMAITHGKKTDEVNRVCLVDMASGKSQSCLHRFLVSLSSPIRLASVANYIVVADENNRRLLMFTDGLKYMWTLTTELRGAMRLAADTRKLQLYVAVNKWEDTSFVRGDVKLYELI